MGLTSVAAAGLLVSLGTSMQASADAKKNTEDMKTKQDALIGEAQRKKDDFVYQEGNTLEAGRKAGAAAQMGPQNGGFGSNMLTSTQGLTQFAQLGAGGNPTGKTLLGM